MKAFNRKNKALILTAIFVSSHSMVVRAGSDGQGVGNGGDGQGDGNVVLPRPSVCETIDDCNQLIRAAQIRIRELQPASSLEPAVKILEGEHRGKVLGMMHDQAKAHCENLNSRLPTIKELAKFLNPLGVSDEPTKGFIEIVPMDGKNFYYNSKTFLRPSVDEEKGMVWSLSLVSHDPFFAFYFDGRDGTLNSVNRFDVAYESAVRCVKW